MEQTQARTSHRGRRRWWRWVALTPLLHGCLLTVGCGHLLKNSIVEGVSVFITGQVTQIDTNSVQQLLDNLFNLIPGQDLFTGP